MLAIALQSGSNGNCVYVEAGGRDDRPSVRLLFDAGISGKRAADRLAAHGRDIRDVDALLISHDHADHALCMGVYHRKFNLPVYVTAQTYRAAAKRCTLGQIEDIRNFDAGGALRFGEVTVETVPTPHDGVDGVGFVVDDGKHRLGILTDLGHVFDGLADVIGTLDAVVIESNYDPHMLANGPYPAFLKARIKGPGGHISNIEAAELLSGAAGGRLRWAALAHLSEDNNDPKVALVTHRQVLGDDLPLHVAGRYASTDALRV